MSCEKRLLAKIKYEAIDEVEDESDRLLSHCLMSGRRNRKIGKDRKCFIIISNADVGFRLFDK